MLRFLTLCFGATLLLSTVGCRTSMVSTESKEALTPLHATYALNTSETLEGWYTTNSLTLRWDLFGEDIEHTMTRGGVTNVAARDDWLAILNMPLSTLEPAGRKDPVGTPLRVLSQDVWTEANDAFLETLLPEARNQAIVVNILDLERVIYRDESDRIIRTSIEKKPRDVPLHKVYRFENIEDAFFDQLDEFLLSKEIKDQVVLFRTGDSGLLAKPLYLVNLKDGEHALLSFDQYNQGSPSFRLTK